jgi:hypothetical protein
MDDVCNVAAGPRKGKPCAAKRPSRKHAVRRRDISARSMLLPLVISRVADLMLATDVPDGPSCFHRFQDRDDLMFAEFALPHRGLLASYS